MHSVRPSPPSPLSARTHGIADLLVAPCESIVTPHPPPPNSRCSCVLTSDSDGDNDIDDNDDDDNAITDCALLFILMYSHVFCLDGD
ncbi:unnamed protein product [Mesocestoides corti]|uniref:Uncharacterized protein n=1 Tax=Mesocestoides corti TaxID=53468 RepID=A0A0R3UMB8_MESCO|nr:unnamed protein product [Mesocestoides corti]